MSGYYAVSVFDRKKLLATCDYNTGMKEYCCVSVIYYKSDFMV